MIVTHQLKNIKVGTIVEGKGSEILIIRQPYNEINGCYECETVDYNTELQTYIGRNDIRYITPIDLIGCRI